MPATPVLYFDITDIVIHSMSNSAVSGVQRSVLKIIEDTIVSGRNQVFGLVKHPVNSKFMVADLSFMKDEYKLSDFYSRFDFHSGKELWLSRAMSKHRGGSLTKVLQMGRRQIQWTFSRTARERAQEKWRNQKPSCLSDQAIVPRSVILSLGAAWGSDYKGIEVLARQHACKIVSMVHDMIPIYGTGFTGSRKPQFQKWLHFASERASLLLCNSKFTQDQLEKYLKENGLWARTAVVQFPHEFSLSAPRHHYSISEQVNEIIGSRYILCVGTIDMRKNTGKLVTEWQKLKAIYKAQTPLLVIAGGKGRGASSVFQSLQETSNLGGFVKVVDSPNDAELELLYQNCQFTVFPSQYEGWGLPIGESLWFGKPVICANKTSMPEAGGSFATYFDDAAPGSLLAAIRQMIDEPVTLPPDIRNHLTAWSSTAASLYDAIKSLEDQPATSAALEFQMAV